MFGHREARLGQIEHLPLLSPPDHRRRQPGEAMATRFRLVPLDDVGLGDRLQRASGMSRLPAARLPDLPRVLPAIRCGFLKPSLEGGLLLFELFLSS